MTPTLNLQVKQYGSDRIIQYIPELSIINHYHHQSLLSSIIIIINHYHHQSLHINVDDQLTSGDDNKKLM